VVLLRLGLVLTICCAIRAATRLAGMITSRL
jgi:hypothetical protein